MRPRIFNLFLIGSVAVGCLALVVVNAVQIMVDRRPTAVVKADRELGWRFCGQRSQRELGFDDFVLRFDERGCRGPLGLSERLRGHTLFLGNSVTLGQQVPEDQTFAALMGGVNAGGDGYDSYQQIEYFRRDLMDLQPRRVVMVVVGVDLMTLRASRERRLATAAANPDLAPWFERLTDLRAARKSLRRGFNPLPGDQPNDPGRDPAYLSAATQLPSPETWRDWTAAVTAFARELGPDRLVIVLSPPRAQVAAWRVERRESPLAAAISQFCAGQGIAFLDILPKLAQHDPELLYCDHVHFTIEGHSKIAVALRRAGLE